MNTPRILCAGELLIDLISTEYAADFRSANTYRRFVGGSPANLAANLSLLGYPAGLAATVGRDDAGDLMLEDIADRGVDPRAIRRVDLPSSLILVTKSREVSDFEPYRSADAAIVPEQVPAAWLDQCELFHTTAFALSRDPARSTLLEMAASVAGRGARVSIDANYASKIWPDRAEARRTMADYLTPGGVAGQSMAKFSDVDYERLFGDPVGDPARAVDRIHALGAGVVCLTLGERGCYVSSPSGRFSLATRAVEVQDTTGAGDAFWSGFLAAWLGDYDWPDCARAGRGMAERKLGQIGQLRGRVDLQALVADTGGPAPVVETR